MEFQSYVTGLNLFLSKWQVLIILFNLEERHKPSRRSPSLFTGRLESDNSRQFNKLS